GPAASNGEVLEPEQVKLGGGGAEHVAAAAGANAIAQLLPQFADIHLQILPGRARRVIRPQPVNYLAGRDGPVCAQEQNRQQPSLLGASELDVGVIDSGTERP